MSVGLHAWDPWGKYGDTYGIRGVSMDVFGPEGGCTCMGSVG